MFVVEPPPWVLGGLRHVHDVLIVIDAKTEIGFWHGALFCYGDVAPSCEVLVCT